MANHSESTNTPDKRMTVFSRVPAEHRRMFQDKLLETNIGRMFILSIYLIIVQIALNVINILRPSDGAGSNINIYIALSMTLLAMGVGYLILFSLVKRGRLQNRTLKIFLVESLLYGYFVIQLIFCTLNVISTGGVNSYVIAILIMGLVPVISPRQSILTIVGGFVYLLVAMYAARFVSDAWNSIWITDTWANVLIITVITLFISIVIYNMYESNFMQSMRLQEYNKDLLAMNSELADLNSQLKVAANTDQMTGVLNRRAFSQNFDILWNASMLERYKIAIAIVDIDFFKAYNDRYGHLKGDECLREVADSLKQSFQRSDDMVYRYGGEEFLVIFNANHGDAYALVEKARQNVENLKIEHANTSVSPYVTISAGMCVIAPAGGISDDMALQIADDALYEAKHTGRNKVVMKEYTEERAQA